MLSLSKFLSIIQTDLKRNRDILIVLIIILVPLILTTIQPDPGSALIFLAFIFLLSIFSIFFLVSLELLIEILIFSLGCSSNGFLFCCLFKLNLIL